MILELSALFGLIAVGGLFAMAEIALVSVRKSHLEQLKDEGDLRAVAALELANAPQNLLSTVQCGITLISILAGAVGGVTFADKLEFIFKSIPYLGHYSHEVSLGAVVVVITYVNIVIGELVPKNIAIAHAEMISLRVARPMKLFLRLSHPIAYFLSGSTGWVLRRLRLQHSSEPEITRDEIELLIEKGAQSGALGATEQQILERVFRLRDRLVSTLMTQRGNVVWLDLNADKKTNLDKMAQSQHSHLPLCDGSLDRVLGMINIKDVLLNLTVKKDPDFRELATPPLFVPDNLSALRVLTQFKDGGTHVALVLDEYGNLEGVVTLNDFMEAIIGEMSDELAVSEPAVVKREGGSWLVDGQFPNDELRELLDVPELHQEERGDYQTLAGMILALLGRIPVIGDHFEWDRFRFEVVDMDGNRIDRVLITPLTAEEQEP